MPRTCAMHSHKPDICRLQFAKVEGCQEQRLLAGAVGCCEAAAAPILVDSAAADVRPDRGAGQAFLCNCKAVLSEHQCGEAFAAAVPISSHIERLAAAHR